MAENNKTIILDEENNTAQSGSVPVTEFLPDDNTPDSEYLLEVRNMKKYFPIKSSFFRRVIGNVKAVDGISFKIKRGTTMGLVGESGCGKSTAGRTLLRLQDITEGEVLFNGVDIFKLHKNELRKLRPKIQIIFQDPYSSLSPRLPVGEIIGEAVREHNIVPKDKYDEYISMIMRACGLQEYHKDRYPHEFSGGQRQRICIARALALNPDFIVCDEPVSALDVSIQAQIINLLKQLQKEFNLTYLFISHDLSVVEHISDTVGVMYLGNLVEYAETDKIFSNPLHPYTKALFSAIPVPDPDYKMERIVLEGSIPSPANPPAGCKFHTRCKECHMICKYAVPAYKEIEPGHFCACHLYNTQEENDMYEQEIKETIKNEEENLKKAKKIKKAEEAAKLDSIDNG
ncbi:MAG: ABC transporter ATP-binding protein [Clostridia bacterium]|nr:ABC transporter ATP-binding protein [Clostridia bacterium]